MGRMKTTTNGGGALHISERMRGKLDGIPCMGTSCLFNPVCEARRKNGNSICSKCYAVGTCMQYEDLTWWLFHNQRELTTRVIPYDELPTFRADKFPNDEFMVRQESFGDTMNIYQAVNYVRTCLKNGHCRFAIWSKNLWIWDAMFANTPKPKNMRFVYSNPDLNGEEDESIFEKHPYIDCVFTVFTPGYIKEHDIKINCGARSCKKCGRCYKGRTKFIREKVK